MAVLKKDVGERREEGCSQEDDESLIFIFADQGGSQKKGRLFCFPMCVFSCGALPLHTVEGTFPTTQMAALPSNQ